MPGINALTSLYSYPFINIDEDFAIVFLPIVEKHSNNAIEPNIYMYLYIYNKYKYCQQSNF